MKKYKVGYTTGVFDLFHIGHLNILKRAKDLCEYLIVGVSTDELVQLYKKKTPVIPYKERVEIVSAIKYTDLVIPQIDMNKISSHKEYNYNVVFVGDDWKGSDKWNQYEKDFELLGVKVVYLPYTDGISSSLLLKKIIK